jgi:hypothetical protein
MKFAAAKYGNQNSLVRHFILIYWICAGIHLPAQILSFETEVIETESYDAIYRNTIETHDSGFLFLTSSQVTKISRKGKILWQYEFKDGRNPLPQYPFYPGVGEVFEDKGGIYLFGGVFSSPYYLWLNHEGILEFDTVYFDSWKDTLAPFNEGRNTLKDGDYFIRTGITYENLWFDSLKNRWEWDRSCYAFHKFDKFGKRISNYYKCLSDTSQFGGDIVKLNSLKKEYLVNMVITNSQSGNYLNFCVLHVDSLGQVISINYLPYNSTDVRRFVKLYGPDEGEGACAITYKYHYYINKEGKLVKQVPIHEVVTYGIKNVKHDTFTFFDSSMSAVWEKRFEFANTNTVIKNEEGREFAMQYEYYIPYNQTYRGLLRIYDKKLTHEEITSGDFKLGYKLIHINKEGWPIGYDPENEPPDIDTLLPEPLPKEIGFTQSGDLRLPAALSGWQLRVSDMAGKTLFKGEVPTDGMVSMPPLATGIYIIQCHNPQTGEKENRKIWKAKG